MVIYDYKCLTCGSVFEERRTMSDDSPVTCPSCGGNDTKKLISSATSIMNWKDSASVHSSQRFRGRVLNRHLRPGGLS